MGERGPTPTGVAIEVGKPLEACPKPPKGLSDGAKAIWQEYAPLVHDAGLLTTADLLSFELLCNAGDRARHAAWEISKDGTTTTGSRGQAVEHPAVGIERMSQQQFLRWADKFGLTPGSRARLAGTGKPKEPEDDVPGVGDAPEEM